MQTGNRLPHLTGRYYAPTEDQSPQPPAPVPVQPVPQIATPQAMVDAQRNVAESQVRVQQQAQAAAPPRPLNRFDEFIGDFQPAPGVPPPPVLSQYIAQDSSLTNPRFMRFTTPNIHIDGSHQKNLGIPFACVWQPLAELEEGETQIPIIEQKPFRCTRCMAYVNPNFQFVSNGRQMKCNICGMVQDTPEEYLQSQSQFPELNLGTYEFVAPPEYISGKIHQPLFIFCIETSALTSNSGLLPQVATSLMSIVEVMQYQNTRIGIMTFDSHMKFYRIGANGETSEVICNEILDPFVPDPIEQITFSLEKDRDALFGLLEKLSVPSQSNVQTVMSLRTLTSAFRELLKECGGHLIIFTGLLGTVGKDILQNRDNPDLYNTDKEKNLFNPQNSLFIEDGEEFSKQGVIVDIVACPQGYLDLTTLGCMTNRTGGDIHYFPRFNSLYDGEKLHYKLFRILTRQQGTQVMMRVRTSAGISVDQYIGKYTRRGPNDLQVAGIDSDKSILIVLKHDEKLVDNQLVHVQGVVLYTSFTGQKLIRIFNGRLVATANLSVVYRTCDCDVFANAFARICNRVIPEHRLANIRENWTGALVKLLYAYKVSAGQRSQGNFSIPDSLKLLPLYTITAMKLPAFSLNRVSPDLRMYSSSVISAATVAETRLLFYPTVYRINNLLEQEHGPGTESASGTVLLPEIVPCSFAYMKQDEAYLLNNGEILVMAVGEQVSYEFLYNVFGVSSFQEFYDLPKPILLEEFDTEESERLMAIIGELRQRNKTGFQTLLVTPGTGQENGALRALMVEDPTPAEMGYQQYVAHVHKLVMDKCT